MLKLLDAKNTERFRLAGELIEQAYRHVETFKAVRSQ